MERTRTRQRRGGRSRRLIGERKAAIAVLDPHEISTQSIPRPFPCIRHWYHPGPRTLQHSQYRSASANHTTPQEMASVLPVSSLRSSINSSCSSLFRRQTHSLHLYSQPRLSFGPLAALQSPQHSSSASERHPLGGPGRGGREPPLVRLYAKNYTYPMYYISRLIKISST